MHFLGIEIGHGSVRVAALDLEAAEVVAKASTPLTWIEGLPAEYAEQDPAQWIAAVRQTVDEVLKSLGEARENVAAMGVTAPAGGVVVLDPDDRIVRPAKRGNDRSAKRQVEEIGRAFGGSPGLIEMTGNPLDAGSMAAQLLWLKEHETKHFERAARFLSAQDFIGYWLTGVNATSLSTASTSGFFDVSAKAWCPALLEFIDARLSSALPPCFDPRQPRGELRASLAKDWGLPESVLVATGCDARMASLFACGAAEPGDLLADVSAHGSLVAVSDRAMVDFRGEGNVGRDVAGNGITSMHMDNVIAATELVRRQYGWSNAEFEQAISQVPAGADGLLFLPYLQGESVPRMKDGSGVLHGITLDNFTPGNLARAAAEGVALGFGYAMSRLRDIGLEPEEIRLTRDVGVNGSQLLADVVGLPVVAQAGGGDGLLGAAMQAAVTYFHHEGQELDFADIAGYVVTPVESTRRLPDAERHGFYNDLLARQQYLAETLHAGGFL